MTWAAVLILAGLALGATLWLMKVRQHGWQVVGAVLLLGLAGYALQGSPTQPGAPKMAAQPAIGDSAALVAARQQLKTGSATAGNSWLVIGDALARNGQFADAAGIFQGAVEQNPKDPEGWLALANALVGHADGTLSPAALYAYRRASAADPRHPGPPFFLGLALAQNGRLQEGRMLWAGMLATAPKDAPWRADLAKRLADLDAFIARQPAPAAQQ